MFGWTNKNLINKLETMKKAPIDENEMVLAFLRAEIDSARFSGKYKKYLSLFNRDRSLIEKANLKDQEENEARLKLLNKTRGYTSRKWLFKNFPRDVQWYRVNFVGYESRKIKFAHYKDWTKLTKGTRFAFDGAQNIDTLYPGYNHKVNVKAIVEDLKNGKTYPELICAALPNSKEIVLIEGHTRATAYFYLFGIIPEKFPVIVGYSKNISEWQLF